MRADAARNFDAVLQTAARLLAADPGTSVSTIAAEAGVDRRTVYRRFASRDALLCAIFDTKLAAMDGVLTGSRLSEAPVAVALHRLVEGAITVFRRYPIDQEQMRGWPDAYSRILEQHERVEEFLRRAADEGLVRSDLPDGLAMTLLYETIALLALRFPEMEPGYATDIAVGTLLNGIGRHLPKDLVAP